MPKKRLSSSVILGEITRSVLDEQFYHCHQGDIAMFLKKAWYVAAWSAEVTPTPVARRICDEPVVLYRDHSGRIAALQDSCCHRGAALSVGRVVERGLQCGYHGLIFGADGICVHIPGQDQIPSTAKVRSYPIVEQDDLAWIWMGPPEEADPGKIVRYPFHGDLKWPYRSQRLRVNADYLLLVDNLMDLTHLGYVHSSTVGGNPLVHVEAKTTTAQTSSGLKLTRRMFNSPPPPTYVKAVGFKGNVDRWQEFKYIAPSTVLQWSGAVDANLEAPNAGPREGGFSLRIFHGITPETSTTCHYFWSAANGYRQDDPEATEQLFEEINVAFAEDKAMIELQQLRLKELGEGALIAIQSDKARLSMRRALNGLLSRETG